MLMMLAESLVSRSHERTLREQGAIEPPGDVYATMRWAYPGAFLAMAAEGMLVGPPPARIARGGSLSDGGREGPEVVGHDARLASGGPFAC